LSRLGRNLNRSRMGQRRECSGDRMGDSVEFLRPAGRPRHICRVRNPLFDGLEVGIERRFRLESCVAGSVGSCDHARSNSPSSITDIKSARCPDLRHVGG
jgi:hypothetical protein